MTSEIDFSSSVLAIWKEMLGTILGWSERRVLEWARELEREMHESLADPHSAIYCESLAYWVIPELIPKRLKSRLHAYDLNTLEGRIESAILAGNPEGDLRGDYDWNAARDRVEFILKEFGESLKDVQA
jgi:hypothetical protein